MKWDSIASLGTAVLISKLNDHLNEIDEAANAQMEMLTKQMAKTQGITVELKVRDQMAWVRAMENIRNAVEEIILNELIYA